MAGSDPWKRYLDAGMELTNLTRDRAEKIVKEFVKAGEVQREHAQARVDDLLERSRKASSALADTVRVEVTRQLTELGLINAKPVQKAASAAKKASASAKKTPGAAKTAAKKATGTAKKTAGAAKKKAAGAS
jgi:polyhydroxyalkanoate synthesis regulator phasin